MILCGPYLVLVLVLVLVHIYSVQPLFLLIQHNSRPE